jgi:hypothetical protein
MHEQPHHCDHQYEAATTHVTDKDEQQARLPSVKQGTNGNDVGDDKSSPPPWVGKSNLRLTQLHQTAML